MAKSKTLNVKRRELLGTSNTRRLRRTGVVPAVLYGHGVKNLNLSLDAIQLRKTLRQAGTSTLVDLVVDDRPAVKVLPDPSSTGPINPWISQSLAFS
jgi:large subunit ribosomal protein L25